MDCAQELIRNSNNNQKEKRELLQACVQVGRSSRDACHANYDGYWG